MPEFTCYIHRNNHLITHITKDHQILIKRVDKHYVCPCCGKPSKRFHDMASHICWYHANIEQDTVNYDFDSEKVATRPACMKDTMMLIDLELRLIVCHAKREVMKRDDIKNHVQNCSACSKYNFDKEDPKEMKELISNKQSRLDNLEKHAKSVALLCAPYGAYIDQKKSCTVCREKVPKKWTPEDYLCCRFKTSSSPRMMHTAVPANDWNLSLLNQQCVKVTAYEYSDVMAMQEKGNKIEYLFNPKDFTFDGPEKKPAQIRRRDNSGTMVITEHDTSTAIPCSFETRDRPKPKKRVLEEEDDDSKDEDYKEGKKKVTPPKKKTRKIQTTFNNTRGSPVVHGEKTGERKVVQDNSEKELKPSSKRKGGNIFSEPPNFNVKIPSHLYVKQIANSILDDMDRISFNLLGRCVKRFTGDSIFDQDTAETGYSFLTDIRNPWNSKQGEYIKYQYSLAAEMILAEKEGQITTNGLTRLFSQLTLSTPDLWRLNTIEMELEDMLDKLFALITITSRRLKMSTEEFCELNALNDLYELRNVFIKRVNGTQYIVLRDSTEKEELILPKPTSEIFARYLLIIRPFHTHLMKLLRLRDAVRRTSEGKLWPFDVMEGKKAQKTVANVLSKLINAAHKRDIVIQSNKQLRQMLENNEVMKMPVDEFTKWLKLDVKFDRYLLN